MKYENIKQSICFDYFWIVADTITNRLSPFHYYHQPLNAHTLLVESEEEKFNVFLFLFFLFDLINATQHFIFQLLKTIDHKLAIISSISSFLSLNNGCDVLSLLLETWAMLFVTLWHDSSSSFKILCIGSQDSGGRKSTSSSFWNKINFI